MSNSKKAVPTRWQSFSFFFALSLMVVLETSVLSQIHFHSKFLIGKSISPSLFWLGALMFSLLVLALTILLLWRAKGKRLDSIKWRLVFVACLITFGTFLLMTAAEELINLYR